jgi:hypothetical protein
MSNTLIPTHLTEKQYYQVRDFCVAIRDKQQRRGSRDHINNDTSAFRLSNDMVGKLGELAATLICGGTTDLRVWNSGSRGIDQFEADIVNCEITPIKAKFSKMLLNVKTCNIKHIKYDKRRDVYYPSNSASWTVDKNDPLMTNPKEDDVLVLMFADDRGNAFYLGYVFATEIAECWKACLSPHMAHKRAIYYPDISKFVKV